jgi:hypothetical protein
MYFNVIGIETVSSAVDEPLLNLAFCKNSQRRTNRQLVTHPGCLWLCEGACLADIFPGGRLCKYVLLEGARKS